MDGRRHDRHARGRRSRASWRICFTTVALVTDLDAGVEGGRGGHPRGGAGGLRREHRGAQGGAAPTRSGTCQQAEATSTRLCAAGAVLDGLALPFPAADMTPAAVETEGGSGAGPSGVRGTAEPGEPPWGRTRWGRPRRGPVSRRRRWRQSRAARLVGVLLLAVAAWLTVTALLPRRRRTREWGRSS